MKGLTTKVVARKACEIELELNISKDVVASSREKAFANLQKQVEIKGFRKGKAPIDVVKDKFAANAEHEMLQVIIPRAIYVAIQKEDIKALFYPEVKELDFEEDGAIKFKAVVEVEPKFEVKKYKGLRVKQETVIVIDKEVDEYIGKLREQGASMATDEAGVVKEDSFVAIDYEGKIDGESFEGGSEKDRLLSIKNSGFIDGFAEGLIGLKVGDEKDLDLKFPENYHSKEVAGKKVVFSVKVLEIKKKVLQELNDDFAKNFGMENLEGFQAKVKEILMDEKQNKNKRETEDSVIDELIKNNPIEVSKTMVKNEAERMAEQTKKQYEQYGMKDFDVTPMMDKFKEDAKRQVKAYYLLNAIVDQEGLKATDEDLEAKMKEYIEKNSNKEEEVKKYFEDPKNKVNIMTNIVHTKLFGFLLKHAKK